jgi:hypothetical protein
MQIRLPATRTTAIATMLIGDFLVDSSESGRGEIHHCHGRKLGGTKDIAEGCYDRPMHLCAGSFAVSIWLHDCSRPLPCSRHGGRPQRPRTQKSELCAQRRGPIRPDATAIKLSPALNGLNASKLGKKDVRRFTSAWGGADPARTTCWRAPPRRRSRPARHRRASTPHPSWSRPAQRR